ncbi:MAG: NAD-dependent succinate-semialdehyde dehydrogenase [Acidimicrobiia bacterium]|nr:NAD-dependent succinate-semialdehyde dehydrogenase [Acidimicrobiia bacterium]MDH4309763.1 NAD-dependent succinate-semialdehyde dehydrogenase [Acidimicrobiia bacterium]
MTLLDQLKHTGKTNLVIDGEWREASDGAEISVLDPSTGGEIATVPSGSKDDALAAVDAAAEAAGPFAAMPPRQRAEILRKAFEIMNARADEIAGLIVAEMGKAYVEARAEAVYAAEFFRWFSEEAVRNIGYINTAPGGDKRIIAVHQPIGVSLLITPWNFPAAMATRKIGPAVAAGCTMILKPASDTPLTALAVAQILEEAGLPKGVLNVLPSRRSGEVVSAMLADDRVRNLSFTGSTEVGRGLLEQTAKRVVRASMELGGNAPFLVFEDADIDAAVDGCMIAKMRNGGQSCIAANRIFVHEAVAAGFTEKLSAAMNAMKVGPGMESGVTLGPVINERAALDMTEIVEGSTGHGSQVRVGGRRPDRPGFFFEPTVLADVRRDDPILSTEVFGPIAPVVTFATEDEAVALANDTIYGLASYLYTGDLARGMRVAEAIEAGMVGVNRGLISDPAAPFGGVKQSGQGREGSHEGVMEFLETKYIAANW